LEKYFDRFIELKFNEQWLDEYEFDIHHVSDTTYERYFHQYCPERREYATLFVKFTLTSDRDSSLIENTVQYTDGLFTLYLGNGTNRTASEEIALSNPCTVWWFVSCGALVLLYSTPHLCVTSSTPNSYAFEERKRIEDEQRSPTSADAKHEKKTAKPWQPRQKIPRRETTLVVRGAIDEGIQR
jgi:hypothetical protein